MNDNPKPIDTSDVTLSPELSALTEKIAQNTHDVMNNMKNTSESIDKKYTYFAFICYTHADYYEAKRLHRKLETYGLPNRLIKHTNKSKKLKPTFLDHDYLLSNPYEEEDAKALEKSKFLVVVCSKNLAEHDENVNAEIRNFLNSGHSYNQVIPYIVDRSGNPEDECFPLELKNINEKYNINLIGHNIFNPLGKKDRRRAQIKTIAKMHGIDAFELDNEDHKRKLKNTLIRIAAAMLCIVIAFGAYTYISFNTFPCEVNITERLDGTKTWQTESMEADVGDIVEFQIELVNSRGFMSGFLDKFAENNNLKIVSDDVMIRAVLPDNMEYINNSTILYNSNHKEGISLSDNDISTNGINTGDYFINANSYVRFKCKIKDVNLKSGNNQLVTWGTSTIWPPDESNSDEKDAIHIKDDVSIYVNKN